MSDRLNSLFSQKNQPILSVFFTAGFPELNQTVPIIEELDAAGVDLIEIGMPFSDPIADGPTIQHSSQIALDNGMTVSLLLDQLADIRKKTSIPLILMGYLNPVLQYGMEAFLDKVEEIGLDGLILPDLPLQEYEQHFRKAFEQRGIANIFLISPQTSEERIRKIDALSKAFIYIVSTDGTTGKTTGFGPPQKAYFSHIQAMNLNSPGLIGFGVKDRESFETTIQYAQGAIIGSAFIKAIQKDGKLQDQIPKFIQGIRD